MNETDLARYKMSRDAMAERELSNKHNSPNDASCPCALELRGVSRQWGDFALRDIYLRLRREEYCVILGPSGSGKTLLLETIAGLHAPETGTILLNGQDVTHWPPERRRIGFVYQHYHLFPHLSVIDNIAYGLRYQRISKAERKQRIAEVVEALGIGYLLGRTSVQELSGGERQKVALARALVIAPSLWLLDEPLTGLDYPSRESVLALLKSIKQRFRLAVLHVTHDYSEALALADKIAVMFDGRIVQVGPPKEVFWRPSNRAVAQFLGVANIIPARVEGRMEQAVRINVEGQVLIAQSARAPADSKCWVCIRPEDLTPATPASDRPNIITGRLIELAERGFAVRATVQVGQAQVQCVLASPLVRQLHWRIGDTVAVSVQPDRIHLLEE